MIYKRINKKGFTLMELLVTVILVAVLASYGVYYYSDILDEGKANAAKGKLASLGGATSRFILENITSPQGLLCGDIQSANVNISTLLAEQSSCVGHPVDNKWYMSDVFRCGYAENSLSWDDNFDFYFGCPNASSACGTGYDKVSVYMKPKTGVNGPACAYFDPNNDKVMEVSN